MSGLNRSAIVGALMAMASAPVLAVGNAVRLVSPQTAAMGEEGSGSSRYRGGPGFTAAHVKRMAKKRRNQQRNKKACRGSAAFR